MGQEASKPITPITKRADVYHPNKENAFVQGQRPEPRTAHKSQGLSSENINAGLVKIQHKASLSQQYTAVIPQSGFMKVTTKRNKNVI